jgi:predicted RNA polymerase sigma factor
MPAETDWAGRLDSVLHVLYLIFNEGYTSTSGPVLHRHELSNEAIRLTRLVHGATTRDPEVSGLLALMLLTDARRPARTAPDGTLIPMHEQDRGAWSRAYIAEGVRLVSDAMAQGPVGAYQLQAAIAALHDEAPSVDETDWRQIAGLYEVLLSLSDNPVVALNHAVAVAMYQGPRVGLDLLDGIACDRRIADDHRVEAVRGHLHEMTGDSDAARTSYRAAAQRTTNPRQQRYLLARAARLRP